MHASSNNIVYVFRLMPHQDLKKSILEFAKANQIEAGIILTCVGSLEKLNLRYANQKEGTSAKGYFEIVSLTGTFTSLSCHLHLCVSDNTGKTTGGHLLEDNLIYTTAEIAIAALTDLVFERTPDPTYGYHELNVKRSKRDV
jgi:predicted DNA-binding protein with PD1-like motif